MRLALWVFGIEVFAVEWDADDGDDVVQWNGAGQSVNIDSPSARYDPDDRYRWDEDDGGGGGKFGFM